MDGTKADTGFYWTATSAWGAFTNPYAASPEYNVGTMTSGGWATPFLNLFIRVPS